MITKVEEMVFQVENVRNASIAVGTSAVTIAPEVEWGVRRVIVITNTSTAGQVITLAWDGTPVAGAGVVLNPNSTWSEAIDPAFTPNNKAIYAIGSALAGSVSVHERVLERV